MMIKIMVTALFSCNLFAAENISINMLSNNLANTQVQTHEVVTMNFTNQDAHSNWRISNDGVMGGKSQSDILFNQDHWIFSGHISTENNGGFSSVFYPVPPLSKEITAVNIDVQGDGHRYQLRMIANIKNERIYYSHEFNTVIAEQQNLSFKLADFQATYRGRKLTNAPKLEAQYIDEAGFLLTKKQAGEFSLSVFSIDFLN